MTNKKQCQHGEIHFINGVANYLEIDYNICVCIECGKTLFQIKEDKTGELWQTEKYVDEHGYKLFRLTRVNNNLWGEIMDISVPAPPEVSTDCNVVNLIGLRKILEKYRVLGDEKDGM